MSEAETKAQGQKPKTSGLAITSMILGFVGFCAMLSTTIFGMGGLTCGFLIAGVGLIFGIQALVRIKSSDGFLKGQSLAIVSIITSFAVLFVIMIIFHYIIVPMKIQMRSALRLEAIEFEIRQYAADNDDNYPTPNSWCDLLIKHDDIVETYIGASERCCYYAINPNATLNSPPDMVLAFECKGGWNQFGGQELLTTEYHKGRGCNILFNDGTVHFVKKERLGELKWNGESE
ncbi:MAG: DUF4190 domain-containing protein [Planctomycetota bacterium]|jgi:hypothetical protein